MRPPTIARISVVGPSATTRPPRHQDRAVGVGVGLLEVVRGEEDRAAARGELAHRAPEGVAALDVHRRGRLVEHEQRRVADEREREADALRLAAGELLRPPARRSPRSRPARAPRRRRAARGTATRPSRRARARTGRGSACRSGASRRPGRPAIASAGERPSTDTLPASGSASPSSMSIVVDLPAPLGPSSATISPARIEMSTPRTASTVPCGVLKDFSRPRSSTPGAAVHLRHATHHGHGGGRPVEAAVTEFGMTFVTCRETWASRQARAVASNGHGGRLRRSRAGSERQGARGRPAMLQHCGDGHRHGSHLLVPRPRRGRPPARAAGPVPQGAREIGFVPNVFRTYAFRPERLSAWFAHFRCCTRRRPG